MEKIEIHSDGGSRGNPGIGSWAAVLVIVDENASEKNVELSGSTELTTNNKMELTAAIEGLRYCHKNHKEGDISIYTDSKYVRDGISKWIINWKRNNWRTANKKPVKNQELWQELDALDMELQTSWKWVKGHNGDHRNERADELCNLEMDKLGGY